MKHRTFFEEIDAEELGYDGALVDAVDTVMTEALKWVSETEYTVVSISHAHHRVWNYGTSFDHVVATVCVVYKE